MRYPRAALETSQPWRGSYRNTGECKHENADHLMAGERWALVDDPVSEFGQRVTQCEQLRCLDCGDWLPLGPALDTGEHAASVAIEQRAAELALKLPSVYNGQLHIKACADCELCGIGAHAGLEGYWEPQKPHDAWHAGYLARCIATHQDPK